MGMDDRILHLVRQEIKEVADAIGAPVWSENINDLHTELHALATRVAKLEQRLSDPSETAKAPARAPRKAPAQ